METKKNWKELLKKYAPRFILSLLVLVFSCWLTCLWIESSFIIFYDSDSITTYFNSMNAEFPSSVDVVFLLGMLFWEFILPYCALSGLYSSVHMWLSIFNDEEWRKMGFKI